MKKAIRPEIFKWRQTAPELIICAVRWYLRYSLSFRDVEELLAERGLEADHTTIWRASAEWTPKMRQLAKHLFTVNGERCYDVVKTEVFCGVQGAGGTVSMQVVLQ